MNKLRPEIDDDNFGTFLLQLLHIHILYFSFFLSFLFLALALDVLLPLLLQSERLGDFDFSLFVIAARKQLYMLASVPT